MLYEDLNFIEKKNETVYLPLWLYIVDIIFMPLISKIASAQTHKFTSKYIKKHHARQVIFEEPFKIFL